MSIDVVRTTPERTSVRERRDDSEARSEDAGGRGARLPRLIDVSDVSAATVAEYARDAVGTDDLYLERRPGRTFLVVR
ncbi:hypothetical protein ACFPYI_06675 [Halomarina salina]|uniref:Uncharacterized protein n=1 Tax=Halomarina salina TaxID=1872699 RepID=A0ABD5RKK9_9EURY|nr:hypothetical protein [Halomarina salina]